MATGYVNPITSGSFERYDQGIDVKGNPGDDVLAIGDALIIRVSQDAGGFGKAVYYRLLSGPGAGKVIYVGHADPAVTEGQRVKAGDAVARLLQVPLGNAPGDPGHTEIGFATASGSSPLYGLNSGGVGGNAFARWLASIGISNTHEYGAADAAVPGAPPPSPPPPSSGGNSGGSGNAIAGVICKAECCWLPIIGEACSFSPLCISCKAAAGAAGVPGQGVPGAIGGAITGAGSILDLLKALLDPQFWIRVGEVIGGGIITLAGLAIIMKHIGLTPPSIPVPVPSA